MQNTKGNIEEINEQEDDINQEIDYISLFAKEKTKVRGIPKRGSKDFEPDGSENQHDALTSSLNALQNALSEERNVSSRQLCKAIWHRAPISKAMITVSKGSHFHNMGHAIKGKMWLYPEECLFLMDRCSLSMQYCGVDMSLQHAYCEIIGEWLTLEKYQVYAYLKRIGFTVLRAQPSPSSSTNTSVCSQSQPLIQTPSHTNATSHQLQQLQLPWFLNRINSFIISPFIYITNLLNSSSVLSSRKSANKKEDQSLVVPGEYRTYEQVYKKLQIIKSSSITHCHNIDVDVEDEGYNIDFLVYKESAPGKFKKKNPGSPLFHVVVASAETQKPPSLPTLCNLFNSFPSSSQTNSSQSLESQSPSQLSTRKNILFAIVDGSNISFLEYNDIMFDNIHVNLISDHVEKKMRY
ncbi:tRNA-splicing endonuclease subunit sen54 N-term-domain-containing protein [Glomus cerebriforme]|uniref:tRNA-splicing endonuclease subunit sen54 N-term-domain-containing protein n=1 Tax=Glomus cerebriforme TaxID=658196 RepID=A0A397TMH3_9GLOM|nr:tRNA-splicing endonuclease subunit sen54 N-term-domain-containing protein [Glomus cerebriforme]